MFIKITRKGTYVLFDTDIYDPKESCMECRKAYGAIYKKYWFTEMNNFFSVHKKKLEVRWKGNYGRQEEDQYSI